MELPSGKSYRKIDHVFFLGRIHYSYGDFQYVCNKLPEGSWDVPGLEGEIMDLTRGDGRTRQVITREQNRKSHELKTVYNTELTELEQYTHMWLLEPETHILL